ncbi:putative holin-like toxin [Loigolactobacillus rennini]
MSLTDTLQLMLGFGNFVLKLITLVVVLIQLNHKK